MGLLVLLTSDKPPHKHEGACPHAAPPAIPGALAGDHEYGACASMLQWAGRGMQAASPRNMLKDDVLHDAPTYEGGHASGARAPDTVAGVPAGQEAMEAGS